MFSPSASGRAWTSPRRRDSSDSSPGSLLSAGRVDASSGSYSRAFSIQLLGTDFATTSSTKVDGLVSLCEDDASSESNRQTAAAVLAFLIGFTKSIADTVDARAIHSLVFLARAILSGRLAHPSHLLPN